MGRQGGLGSWNRLAGGRSTTGLRACERAVQTGRGRTWEGTRHPATDRAPARQHEDCHHRTDQPHTSPLPHYSLP